MGYLQGRAGGAHEGLFQRLGDAGPREGLVGLSRGLGQGTSSVVWWDANREGAPHAAMSLCGWGKGLEAAGGFLASEESPLYGRALNQAGGEMLPLCPLGVNDQGLNITWGPSPPTQNMPWFWGRN